jgi:hypothetical protein
VDDLIEAEFGSIDLGEDGHADGEFVDALHGEVVVRVEFEDGFVILDDGCGGADASLGLGGDLSEIGAEDCGYSEGGKHRFAGYHASGSTRLRVQS